MPDVADPAAQRRGRPRRVAAEEQQTAIRRREQQRQDAQQRRLAGAVRAEQDDRLAGLEREVHAREHGHTPEAAGEALGAERGADH